MKNLLLAALSTVAISAHAWEPDVYVGANGASLQYKHQSVGTNFTINTLEGVAGMRLHEYIAVEARLGFGANTARGDTLSVVTSVFDNSETTEVDETEFTITSADYEVKSAGYASIYLKPMISNEKASLYGLFGFTNVEVEHTGVVNTMITDADGNVLSSSTAEGALFDDSEGNLSYGFGASFHLWEKVELNAEWKKLVNGDEFDMRGGSIGFLYKF